MDLSVDFENLSANGSAIAGLAGNFANVGWTCVSAMGSAAEAVGSAGGLAGVLQEVAALADQTHAGLAQTLTKLGNQTVGASSTYMDTDLGLAQAAPDAE
jgi:hypothetical protein